MSEGPPQSGSEEDPDLDLKAGFKLQEQDRNDPERGPLVQEARAVMREVYKNPALYEEYMDFCDAFKAHFSSEEAQKYRLYHAFIGSTPPGTADRFDAEGAWSIAGKIREFTEKYHIHPV